jgi:4-hydroxy-2-oxovalerate aldolase
MTVKILDTTIRDGSFEVGFQFTLEDVAIVAAILDAAGFTYIEVGHGLGIGASAYAASEAGRRYFGRDLSAPECDERYFRVLRRVVHRAKLGAIFFGKIPGVPVDVIRVAADCQLDFVRIALHAHEVTEPGSERAIRLARELGLKVSINFMKSYTSTPAQLADSARRAADLGADWLYVVDSAGCMVPDEVRRQVEAIREAVGLEVGFHGHNNTSMAVANSLAAIDSGATLVDGSLQGLGRATGNAPTETLVALLQNRLGFEQGIDQKPLFRLSRCFARRLVEPGFDPSHVLSGVASIHSERLPAIRRLAGEYKLDLDDVLTGLGQLAEKESVVHSLPEAVIRRACVEAAGRRDSALERTPRKGEEFCALIDVLAEETQAIRDIADLQRRLRIHILRDRLKTLVAFVPARLWPFRLPTIVQRGGWAVGTIPCDELAVEGVFEHGYAGAVLADRELLSASPPQSHPCDVLAFSLVDLLAEAATADGTSTMALVACEDIELRRGIDARLRRSEGPVILDSERDLPEGDFDSVYVEGPLGRRLVELPAFRDRLRPGLVMRCMGPEALSEDALGDLVRAGAQVHLPDVWSLLVARAMMQSRISVIGTEHTAGPSAYLLVRESGVLLDVQTSSVVGAWAPRYGHVAHDEGRAVAARVHGRRLEDILTGLTGTSVRN